MSPEQHVIQDVHSNGCRVDYDSGAAITAFREQQQRAVQNGNRRTDGRLQRSKNSRMSEWRTTSSGPWTDGRRARESCRCVDECNPGTQWFAH